MRSAAFLAVSACLVLAVLSAPAPQYEKEFVSFMRAHSKTYSHGDFQTRFNAFKHNLDFVLNHDAAAKGYSVGINEFADMTNKEFTKMFNGFDNAAFIKSRSQATAHRGVFVNTFDAPPTSQDWRKKGAVTPIKNQGQCGSCWSFSATGSMEGVHVLSGQGALVGLSEQNLVDCSQAQGNLGCDGGLMDYAFEYVISNNGIDSEASYPYTAEDGTCQFNAANVATTITGYVDIPTGSESSLTSAVGTIGPISVAIDASHESFQLYSGGVYYEPDCSSSQLDHGVLAIGYGTSDGTAYYLVKNSWGTSWGMAGYIWMSRNKDNNCGIATAASYPTITK